MDTDLNKDPEYTKFDTSKVVLTERAVACVESLHGVPDEWLEDRAAAKAMLAWKLLEKYWTGVTMYRDYGLHLEDFHRGQSDDDYEEIKVMGYDGVIASALSCRSRGADFGELNELIDSFKG
jgi:hypothetical protein